MKKPYQYYYTQGDKRYRAVYDALLTGFSQLASVIRVPRIPMSELSELFFQLRLDNPMIFYVVTFSCRAYPDSDYYELLPEYLFDKAKVKTHQKALESRIARLVRPALSLSPLEKETYIHNFICDNVTYDKLEKPYSHEIIGPLTNGVGVCEGISKTVKLLCDELGLECMVAICDSDRANGQKYRHAWNIIKVNGQHYHLDATFDNSLGRYGTKRYDYFNLSDEKIFRDHRPLLYPAPTCPDGSSFYYKEAHLSWTKIEDVEKRVLQAIRKKQPQLVFHWRGGYLTREVALEIGRVSYEAAATKGKSVTLSINWPQAVVQLNLSDQPADLSLEEEQPDEGE
jgi:hypothetical protein